ncbi:MAG: WD40 repeat domain-containing protein [Pyrinomonadaceae bacterium]
MYMLLLMPIRIPTIFVVLALFMVSFSSAQKIERVLSNEKENIYVVGFSPDGKTIATAGGRDSVADMWEVSTGQKLGTLFKDRDANATARGPKSRVLITKISWPVLIEFSRNWEKVATYNIDEKIVRVWDVKNGSLKATINETKKDFGIRFALDPKNRLIATTVFDEFVVNTWNEETGGLEATLEHPRHKQFRYANGVRELAFTPDGRSLVTTSFREVYIWDIASGMIKAKLIDPDVILWEGFKAHKGFSHGDSIYVLRVSPDGRFAATGSRDGTAKIWDLQTRELKFTLKGHKGKVHRLGFSPDSGTLITGSYDKTAKLWNVETGEMKASLPHRGTVWAVSFSPDSELAATASDNEKKVNLWNSATGKLVAGLEGARDPFAFSPDGKTLATGSDKNAVLIWKVPDK